MVSSICCALASLTLAARLLNLSISSCDMHLREKLEPCLAKDLCVDVGVDVGLDVNEFSNFFKVTPPLAYRLLVLRILRR